MKKLFLAAALLVGCSMYQKADAQVSIRLGLNIGSQPDWGPVGYDHASYYYMPDVDAYYDVPNHQYIYLQSNTWIRGASLPGRYNFDPYNSYKVVINEPAPWRRASVYRTKYARYKGSRNQVVIRDSREAKYKNHWQGDRGRDDRRGPGNSDYGHDKGAHGRGNDNGHGNGKGNGHGRGHDN